MPVYPPPVATKALGLGKQSCNGIGITMTLKSEDDVDGNAGASAAMMMAMMVLVMILMVVMMMVMMMRVIAAILTFLIVLTFL